MIVDPTQRSAVTIWRPFNGIGDWLFALACVKYVNRQRPDVDVYVDWRDVRVGRLPGIVPQLFMGSDCTFTPGRGRSGPVTDDSLVYRKWPPDNFIESTVCHLNDQTGLGIRYEHGVYPQFFGARHKPVSNHVVVIGHGKKRGARIGKDWGFENFSALALHLRRYGLGVVQVGAGGDNYIPSADQHVMGRTAQEVVYALAGARAFVGIENGITVLAGFMGVPLFTVYDGHGCPTRLDFAQQTKFIDRIEPEEAAERIASQLCAPQAKEAAC